MVVQGNLSLVYHPQMVINKETNKRLFSEGLLDKLKVVVQFSTIFQL